MKLSVRPSPPDDAAGMRALFAEARMDSDPRHLHWKYWQPRADWAEPRSFVVANGSELLAHGGLVPGTCAWGTRRITMVLIIDWVARSGQPGLGVMLMRYLVGVADALIGIGGVEETTQRLLPHLGFRPAGAVTGYARALFPLRLLRGGATWKLVPRLVRAICRGATPVAPGVEWQTRRLESAEVDQIASVVPVPSSGMAVMGRSAELFRYLLTCPIVPMQLYAVERAARVRGYFLLTSAPGQVRIADCWIDSVDSADWCALILCAVEQAKRDPQAAEVVIWASDRLLEEALPACGFHARFRAIRVREGRSEAVPEGTLRVQMLDSDIPFLPEGPFQYWG
jgi:hypothetical protein